MRELVSSGSPYEPKVGISRAVRAGHLIAVSGTAPLGPDGRTIAIGDPAAQARRCLEIISAALEKAGGATNDGIRAAAGVSDWGRLDFRNAADYDDYVFWLYTLTLAKGPAA